MGGMQREQEVCRVGFSSMVRWQGVNEAAFCREFLSKNKLIYADNAFFTPDGRLTDPLLLLKEKIYAELECCAAKNILRTISNIVEIMKLVVHAESFPPNPDEIHVQNGTLRIDGSFLAGRSEIVRSRFPIDYNPQAGKSVVWLRFLSDLLYPEDIPTFQEYIGYPSWMRLTRYCRAAMRGRYWMQPDVRMPRSLGAVSQ